MSKQQLVFAAAILMGSLLFAEEPKAAPPKPQPSLTVEEQLAGTKLQKRIVEAAAGVEIVKRESRLADTMQAVVSQEWQAWVTSIVKTKGLAKDCQVTLDLTIVCPEQKKEPKK